MSQAIPLGRYLLRDRVGAGGMAEVYRATVMDEDGTVHWVAVKRLLKHLTDDVELVQMMRDEANVAVNLIHENIARMFEFIQVDGESILVLEYVDGKDVRSLIDHHRLHGYPIPAEHVAWIGLEAARGLHAAHHQSDPTGRPLGIIHRDVSPSNILCSYSGQVKICDFGIAKATLSEVRTQTGVIKGKVRYMSPEQTLGERLDPRSDIFSLGSILYEMLTLLPPFSATSEIDLVNRVRAAEKKDARSIQPTIPAALNDIVNQMMMCDRQDRPASGLEVVRKLRQYLDRNFLGYERSHFRRYMQAEFSPDASQEIAATANLVSVSGASPFSEIHKLPTEILPPRPGSENTLAPPHSEPDPSWADPSSATREVRKPNLDSTEPSIDAPVDEDGSTGIFDAESESPTAVEDGSTGIFNAESESSTAVYEVDDDIVLDDSDLEPIS